ncbi:MAG: GTPase Era [Bacteroidales bacterium]|nr:GTPase Era [Bacteroidales bacterium]MDZ4204555.1 GTPase Era [Bacteroidales bacterium]
MGHKAGFVSIIGKPNVGKSTLMNAMIGEKLSIITPKAQTTRHRIRGIISDDDFQVVFSDTPGLLKSNYKLHEAMMAVVKESVEDADMLLFMVELGEKPENHDFIRLVDEAEVPVLLLISKIDLAKDNELIEAIAAWGQASPKAKVIPVSAREGINLGQVMQTIIDALPESPPYFPKEDITDRPLRFFVAETIREKIFLYYRREIPYATTVIVDSYQEGEQLDRIHALIFVERDSQKAILLGHEGKAIKKVGIESRKEIEEFIGKQIYLELTVKVSKDWRNSHEMLKRYGYE